MPPRGRRPDGGPDTRAAILDAARGLFAERGFERATMRDVAARAGVDPALIHHYFGTKDLLLVEALTMPIDASQVLAGLDADPQRAGAEVVRRIVGVWESDAVVRSRLLGLFRVAISHYHAAEVLRDVLGRTILAELQRVVVPDRASLRAALVGTQMSGIFIGRYVLGVPAVRDASTEDLVAAVGPVVQHYLTGPIPAPDGIGRPH